MSTPPLSEPAPQPPQVTLEVTEFPCQAKCAEDYLDPTGAKRPLLVKVCLNTSAQRACMEKTGTVPVDVYACVNLRCGALMTALKSLSPLQELVR